MSSDDCVTLHFYGDVAVVVAVVSVAADDGNGSRLAVYVSLGHACCIAVVILCGRFYFFCSLSDVSYIIYKCVLLTAFKIER